MRTAAPPPWLRRAYRVAIRSLAAGVTAEQVAASIGYSTNHFLARFRKQTGITFGVWLRTVRVRRAARLIEEGATVLDAALSVGYSDARGLQRAFRAIHGCTPTQYVTRRRERRRSRR